MHLHISCFWDSCLISSHFSYLNFGQSYQFFCLRYVSHMCRVSLLRYDKLQNFQLIFSSFHHLQDAFSRFRFNLRWFLILDDGSSQINAQVFARGWNLYQCCKNNRNLWLTWLPDNFKFLLPNSKIS